MPKFFTNAARRVLYIYNNGGFASPGVDEPTVSYPSVYVTNASGTEGATINVRVTASFAVNQNITFTYATANGTAAAGTHYTSTSGTGVILANTTFVDIPISTVDLDGAQGNKTFTLTISNALQGAQSLTILNAVASVLIIDSDVSAGNEYYQYLISQPEILGTENAGYYSLRDNTSINTILGSDGQARKTWEYVYGNDDYSNPQDGAKVIMGHSLSGNHQLKPPLQTFNLVDGSVMFVTDFWFGSEFYDNIDTVFDDQYQQKFYNIQDGGDNGSGGSIYCEPRISLKPHQLTAPAFATQDLRTYGQGSNANNEGPMAEWGNVRNTPYTPSGLGAKAVASHTEAYGKWVRFWFLMELNKPGQDFTDFTTSTGYAGSNPYGGRNVVTATANAAFPCVKWVDIEKFGTGDSFTLTVNGETTASITDPSTANIKSAIEALAGVNTDAITVVQSTSAPFQYFVLFGGNLAGTTPTFSITATGFGQSSVGTLVNPGSYPTVEVGTWDQWWESSKPAMLTTVTIQGHSESALNGQWTVFPLDNTHLVLVDGPTITGGGTGGNCARHFHMFSWFQASEDTDRETVYWKVPLQKRNTGKLNTFLFELNSSSKPKAIKGWDLTVQPSIASPTTITTNTAHGLSTGARVLIVQNSQIPDGHYSVTVTGTNTFTIPVNVTGASTFITSGTYANSYGRVFKPLIGYARTFAMLRNRTLNLADTTFFARPLP